MGILEELVGLTETELEENNCSTDSFNSDCALDSIKFNVKLNVKLRRKPTNKSNNPEINVINSASVIQEYSEIVKAKTLQEKINEICLKIRLEQEKNNKSDGELNRTPDKISNKTSTKIPNTTSGKEDNSINPTIKIHSEYYRENTPHDQLYDIFSGNDRRYFSSKDILKNTIESRLQKINSSELLYKINNASQLVEFYIDFKKKLEDKAKRTKKGISKSLIQESKKIEDALEICISDSLGSDYFTTIKAVIEKNKKLQKENPELNLEYLTLNNKAGIYNAFNKLMEKETERTGYLKQTINPEKIRSEISALTDALYNGGFWTDRIKKIESKIRQIHASSAKCELNNREKVALELIKKELETNRYLHGKKIETDNGEYFTGIRKTKAMKDANSYMNFNNKLHNIIINLDGLSTETAGTYEPRIVEKTSEAFSTAVNVCIESANSLISCIDEMYDSTLQKTRDAVNYSLNNVKATSNNTLNATNNAANYIADYMTSTLTNLIEGVNNKISAEYLATLHKFNVIKEEINKSLKRINTSYNQTKKNVSESVIKAKTRVINTTINTTVNTIKSIEDSINAAYNSQLTNYSSLKNNLGEKVSENYSNLQSMIETATEKAKEIDWPIPSVYALKKGLRGAAYGSLLAGIIMTGHANLPKAKAIAGNYINQYKEKKSEEIASQNREAAHEQKQFLNKQIENQKKLNEAIEAQNKINLEKVAQEEYEKKKQDYVAQRQHKIDTYFTLPIAGWNTQLTSWYGTRIDPQRKNSCIKSLNRYHKAPSSCWETHQGVDVKGRVGTPVYSAEEGIVVTARRIGGYGYAMVILHPNGYSTLYAHGKKGGFQVQEGEIVKRGQYIMQVGATGHVTGPHLHYGLIDTNGNFISPLASQEIFAGPTKLEELAKADYNVNTGIPKWLFKKRHGVTTKVASRAEKYMIQERERTASYWGGSIAPKHNIATNKTP